LFSSCCVIFARSLVFRNADVGFVWSGYPAGKPGIFRNLTLVREKSGKLQKVEEKIREFVACLSCAVAVAIVTK